jgi:hypothetical protein
MSVIRSLAGGGSTGNILGTTLPALVPAWPRARPLWLEDRRPAAGLGGPSIAGTGWTALEAAYVAADSNDPGSTGVGAVLVNFGTDVVADHEPYTDGNIYHGFASTARKTVGDPTPSLTAPHIASIRSAASDWQYWLDGTQFFATATNTVALSATPGVGRDTRGSYLHGKVSEVVLANTTLATEDRQCLEGYLAYKWGTQASLPSTHPYRYDPPMVGAYVGGRLAGTETGADTASITGTVAVTGTLSATEGRAWTPLDLGSDLLAWFVADVANYTLWSLPTAQDIPRYWADSSGNNRYLTSQDDPRFVGTNGYTIRNDTGVSAANAHFYFDTGQALPSGGYDFFAAANPTGTGARVLVYNGDGANWPLYLLSTNEVGSYHTSGSVFTQAGTLTWPSGNLRQVYATYPSATGVAMDFDGSTPLSETGENLTVGTTPWVLNASATPFGDAHELVFTTPGLSSTKKEKLEGYLAWAVDARLGVTTLVDNLPSGHAYKSAAPRTGGDDTASISGTVVDPTGTLAATESGNDSASITGGPDRCGLARRY